MKKTMILFALLAGSTAMGAQASTSVRNVNQSVKPAIKAKPYSCTIALTGSLSVGFGTITATCSATEGTCDLAQSAAAACLTTVLRSLRNQLK